MYDDNVVNCPRINFFFQVKRPLFDLIYQTNGAMSQIPSVKGAKEGKRARKVINNTGEVCNQEGGLSGPEKSRPPLVPGL